MRKVAKKRPGKRVAAAPQIFNDDEYCGDYEDFDQANDDCVLDKFLKLNDLKQAVISPSLGVICVHQVNYI